MLETPEKKRFFTLIGNRKQLEECCRAFGTKMFVVRAEINKSQVMSITKIVAALCDKGDEGQKADYKVLEKKAGRSQ